MNRTEIENEIKKIVAEQFGMDINGITINSNLSTDLNADSLDAVEIIMCVEDKFGIMIKDEDAELMNDIEMIANYVEKELEE